MRRVVAAAFLLAPLAAVAQERTETRELAGLLGSRETLVVLHATQRADGGWQVAGEYVALPTLTRRFLEGERSPQLGVTTLREGTTPILFGRPETATLRGTWREGVFKGMRYGPGGQERETFEFNEDFPSMADYDATVRCEAEDGRYAARLALVAENGRIRGLEWRSRVGSSGHACAVQGLAQAAMRGGLALAGGDCRVTLRAIGDYVRVVAEGCRAACGSEAYLEPMVIDRRGHCRLLRPQGRER